MIAAQGMTGTRAPAWVPVIGQVRDRKAAQALQRPCNLTASPP
ncbi:protein of unknown function [Thauera humireducens]|nr:protein of unknown function [Thauera humireducens]